MGASKAEILKYLAEGGTRLGNEFGTHLRHMAGLPCWEYMEATHALAGTNKSLKNNGSLNEMGANGWEIVFVTQDPDDKELVHIIYKKQKLFDVPWGSY